MPTSPLYRLAARLGSGVAALLAPLSPKLAAGHRGRRDAVHRLAAWAERARDPARPLVWFHAPSVGEGLQARERPAAAPRPASRGAVRLHPLQPLRRIAGPAAAGGRVRLSPLRSRPHRRRAGARPRAHAPGVLQARPLARARHPHRGGRSGGRHRGGHREPGQRTAPLAGANAVLAGISGGHRGGRGVGGRRGAARAARCGSRAHSACWAIPATTA